MTEKLEFTSGDMERWAKQEVNSALKGLLRNLTEVRTQRSVPDRGLFSARQMGEIDGLNIAIAAVKRRIG